MFSFASSRRAKVQCGHFESAYFSGECIDPRLVAQGCRVSNQAAACQHAYLCTEHMLQDEGSGRSSAAHCLVGTSGSTEFCEQSTL